ncbi:MAG: class I SAM-dependent methyltransferase [Candidatus Pacebacteria bacterium]|nr:class I SAM-dependent methyltransferase [Candidatus Paceibacterota bacterium]MDD4074121.1 class I SAM-dependent methyltransferase [Candidatus Paceibacterota bacterium]
MNEGFLNPEKIIRNIPLRSNMNACDLGCGSGGWVIPLAKILNEGTVYAVDILEEVLSALESKILSEGISNIKTIRGDVEGDLRIREEYFDLVLITNLLFQIDNKIKILELAKKLINTNGMILIVDWKKDAPMGSKEGRLNLSEVKEMGEKIGLKVESEFIAGSFHWGIIFKKA